MWGVVIIVHSVDEVCVGCARGMWSVGSAGSAGSLFSGGIAG